MASLPLATLLFPVQRTPERKPLCFLLRVPHVVLEWPAQLQLLAVAVCRQIVLRNLDRGRKPRDYQTLCM